MQVDLNKIKKQIKDKDIGEEYDGRPISYDRDNDERGFGLFRFCGCFILVIILIIFITGLTVNFLVGPAMQKIGSVPEDFPEELTLLQSEQAQISMVNNEGKIKLVEFMQVVPDWILKPFWYFFADKAKEKLGDVIGDASAAQKSFSFEDFKVMIDNIDLSKTKAVSLSWDHIGKTKEEIANYYKTQLEANGFTLKENLSDYEVNLGFWKDEVFGTLFLNDNNGDSQGTLEVNYMTE